MMDKTTYKIEVMYQMTGVVLVDAYSLRDAEEIVLKNQELPFDPEYVDGSVKLHKIGDHHGEIVERDET